MKITLSAAVFTALLVYGMALPSDESKSVIQALAELEDLDYPEESQENMVEDQYYKGEKYCYKISIILTIAYQQVILDLVHEC